MARQVPEEQLIRPGYGKWYLNPPQFVKQKFVLPFKGSEFAVQGYNLVTCAFAIGKEHG
jgi:hypothetical protein